MDQGPPPQADYEPLTSRSAVLNNMEVAYNRRNSAKYEEILDDDFTMYFNDADVLAGRTPDQWGRADEVAVAHNMFNSNYVDTDPSDGIQPRIIGIHMNVKWEDGLQWVEIEPASAPAETWYTATVYLDFQLDVEPDLHRVNNAGYKAQFTVRNAGTEDSAHWQLVEWHDLASETNAQLAAGSPEQTTWGQIKAGFR